MGIRRTLLGCALSFSAIACQVEAPELTTGTVYFELDAQTCVTGGSAIQFLIDGQVIGREAVAPGVLSKAYTTSAGQHTVSAKIVAGGYTMQSMQVVVPAGGPYTAVFSCHG